MMYTWYCCPWLLQKEEEYLFLSLVSSSWGKKTDRTKKRRRKWLLTFDLR
jgi:hypothetical protein